MVKGLYTAHMGMINEQNRLDVITNNMANASTYGFKSEGATSQSFKDVYAVKIKDSSANFANNRIGAMSMGVQIGETYTDYSQGAFLQTEEPYDVALAGNGFFKISFTNKAGQTSVKYTRDGSFTLNNQGYLVTKDGDFVLDTNNNRIQLDTAQTSSIDDMGYIYQNNAQVAQLGIVDFENYNYLEKYGENMYDLVQGGNIIASTAKVKAGYLEASNVNIVSEMVDMITITRAYEANQKVIKTIDSTLEKAVTEVGRV